MRVKSASEVISSKLLYSKWARASERMGAAGFAVSRQSFRVSTGATVFTVGSCFARNIEEHLSLIGCNVPTLAFSVPKSEWRARPNGILNKYTPAAIYQELAWTHKVFRAGGPTIESCEEMRWNLPDGRVVDLQLGGTVPVTEERFLERRFEVYDIFANAFSADCVTITLGLIEAWRDRRTGLFIQSAPVSREMRADLDSFEFAVLDYNDCLDLVSRSIDLIRDLNPESKILITTSPVPMEKTFTEDDVVIANMTSKSILRAVAHEISQRFELVDYFPSYEAVMLSDRRSVFTDDDIHVRDAVVGRIVGDLVDRYFGGGREIDKVIQLAACELSDESAGTGSMQALLASDTKMHDLETDQLIIYLRACWRLRARRLGRLAAAELMRRPERSARHFRAVKHIFPRLGCGKDALEYARGVLERDPTNPLALSLVNS